MIIVILIIVHTTSHFTVLYAVVCMMRNKNLKHPHPSSETQRWCGWKWMMISFPRCQTLPSVDSKSSLKRFTELKEHARSATKNPCLYPVRCIPVRAPKRWVSVVDANQQPFHCGVPSCIAMQPKPGHIFDPNSANDSIISRIVR